MSFYEFLERTNKKDIRNLKVLLTEIYKFLTGLSPVIMNKVFQTRECPYDLRQLVVDKFTKKHKIGFSVESFTTDFLRFSSSNDKICFLGGRMGYLPLNQAFQGLS